MVLVLVAVLLCCSSGCNVRPWWGPPGTVYQQRNQAVLHDPFPDNRAGPAIHGGRPLGYDRPLSEATQLQTSPYVR